MEKETGKFFSNEQGSPLNVTLCGITHLENNNREIYCLKGRETYCLFSIVKMGGSLSVSSIRQNSEKVFNHLYKPWFKCGLSPLFMACCMLFK